MKRLPVGLVALLALNTLGAQSPATQARIDSISACPSISVMYDTGANASFVSVDPIVPGKGFSISIFIVAKGQSVSGAHSGYLAIGRSGQAADAVLPDSVELTLNGTEHLKLNGKLFSPPQNVARFASINMQLTDEHFRQIAGAQTVGFTVGADTVRLTRDQIGAVRTLLDQLARPVTNRRVVRNCASGTIEDAPVQTLEQRRTFFEFQVERPARVTSGSPGPVYPPALRAAKIEGSVTAQFAVLENGTADMDTFRVLRSTNELFSASVRDVVPKLRFIPAEIAGKPVKQLVQLPFAFRVNR